MTVRPPSGKRLRLKRREEMDMGSEIRSWPASRADGTAGTQLEFAAAAIAATLTSVHVQLPLSVPLSVLVGAVLLPVTVRCLRTYRGATTVAITVVIAIFAGVVITGAGTGPTSTSLLIAQSLRLLSLPLALLVLLWSRSLIGTRRTLLFFGLGLLLSVALDGLSSANPWKFSLSLPLTILLLSLRMVFGRTIPQLVMVVLLAGVCVLFDSRSAAGFLLVAAAVSLMRGAREDEGERRVAASGSRWLRYFQFAAVIVGGYLILQGAILEGMLGDEIQARSQAQVAESGSILAGGRPEMGATVALIASSPWGFGSGAMPTPSQVLTAKAGMAALGYDPNNGYVERYMFGGVFEVHSVIGDLWLLFGPAGALVAIVCSVLIVRGVANTLAVGVGSAAIIYVAIRSLWDMGFSPLYTSIGLLPLALAVVAIPRGPAEPTRRRARGAKDYEKPKRIRGGAGRHRHSPYGTAGDGLRLPSEPRPEQLAPGLPSD